MKSPCALLHFQLILKMRQIISTLKQQAWRHESTKLLFISICAKNVGVICDAAAAAEHQALFRTLT